MTYFFKLNPTNNNKDSLIATALNGVIYTENNRLHIKGKNHYLYKFDGSPIGWYMRNPKTLDDIYLGKGASPTAELETLVIKDNEYWLEIIQVEQDINESEL